ncbi:hypothetical protein AAEO50_09765 [Rossellomorea oryzaecorticis]|uniref:Uncharacterized protein n=1 Tax=Rossellomorea oryzaecorticis TaxID=1396505 RepID=A0ABU9K906_9BACI
MERHREPLVSVQVLQKQDGGQNAIAAVSKMAGDKPVLVLYEVEKENKYYFNVLQSVELKEHVEEIKIDGHGEGLWAKGEKDRWYLFSNGLEVLNQTENPADVHSTTQTFQYDKRNHKASLVIDQKEIEIELSKETKPLEIHQLSADDTLWLIVYEDDLVLAQSR